MTPEEKAQELIESFYLCMPFKDIKLTDCGENEDLIIKMEKLSAKQCAEIAIHEILKDIPDASDDDSPYNHELMYWQQVKQEIEKL